MWIRTLRLVLVLVVASMAQGLEQGAGGGVEFEPIRLVDPAMTALPEPTGKDPQRARANGKFLLSAGPVIGTTGFGMQGGLLIRPAEGAAMFGFHALGSRGLFADTLPSSIAAFHLVVAKPVHSSNGPLTFVLMGGFGGATASRKGPLIRVDTVDTYSLFDVPLFAQTRNIYKKKSVTSPSGFVGIQMGSAFPKGAGFSFFTGIVVCAQPTAMISLQVHQADF